MDPTLEKTQEEQDQKKQSGGISEGGINTLNNLVGGLTGNPLNKAGSGGAAQAGRMATQAAGKIATQVGIRAATTPHGLIIIVVIIVVAIIVFMIVFLVGKDNFSINQTLSSGPITVPVEP